MKGLLVLFAATALAASAQTSGQASKSAGSKANAEESSAKSPKPAASKKKVPKPRSSPKSSTTGTKEKAARPEREKAEGEKPVKAEDKGTEDKSLDSQASESTAPGPQAKSSDEPREGPPAPGTKEKSNYGKPALIETSQLVEFESLPEDRKKLIEAAIATARDSPWLPYLFGGSDPKDGGFDCSGAMYYVMKKAGLEPPRTSADQYLWLQDGNGLIKVSPDTRDLDHPSLKLLKPGDLLFWGGTYTPTDGRQVNITHVALYLGHEKKGNRPVMINATDGRSYRGTKANGYGVYDFQLPREGSKTVFMGYGTPPGFKEPGGS